MRVFLLLVMNVFLSFQAIAGDFDYVEDSVEREWRLQEEAHDRVEMAQNWMSLYKEFQSLLYADDGRQVARLAILLHNFVGHSVEQRKGFVATVFDDLSLGNMSLVKRIAMDVDFTGDRSDFAMALISYFYQQHLNLEGFRKALSEIQLRLSLVLDTDGREEFEAWSSANCSSTLK